MLLVPVHLVLPSVCLRLCGAAYSQEPCLKSTETGGQGKSSDERAGYRTGHITERQVSAGGKDRRLSLCMPARFSFVSLKQNKKIGLAGLSLGFPTALTRLGVPKCRVQGFSVKDLRTSS